MSHQYPDPNEIDENLFSRLYELPDGTSMNISWIKKHVWSEAESFEILPSSVIRGMQANMYTIEMKSANADQVTDENEETQTETRRIIAKRVVPSELPPKPDQAQLIQFIHSVRREIEFYKSLMLSKNKAIQHLFPTVYYSSSTPVSFDDTRPVNTSFLLLLSDLSKEYYQSPSMNREQAKALMTAFASFHAKFWHSSEINDMQRGGFWPLQRRLIYGELETANLTWNGVLERFPELLNLGLGNIHNIASKLVSIASVLDHFVKNKCDTMIHGDAKGWNLFLSKTSNEDIIFIDMQWVGKGHPLQDVAYALTTSLEAELLIEMDDFVDHYVKCLKNELCTNSKPIDEEEIRLEYDLIWLDYARVIVTGLWKNLDPERMKRYQKTVGPSMINRSLEHVKFITKRIHYLLYENQNISHKLTTIQAEMACCKG